MGRATSALETITASGAYEIGIPASRHGFNAEGLWAINSSWRWTLQCWIGDGGSLQRDTQGTLVAVDKDAGWGLKYEGEGLRHRH